MNWNDISTFFVERMTFFGAVIGAALIRVLLWLSEEQPEEAAVTLRRNRAKRTFSGIVMGMIVAAIATQPIVSVVPWFNESNDYLLAGLLVLIGEHLVRRLSKPEDIIDRILDRVFGRRGGE